MEVWRDCLTELNQGRIAVSLSQVSEELIVGSVFLYYVYDVLNPFSEFTQYSSILHTRSGEETIVRRNSES